MSANHKAQVVALLKSFETGDSGPTIAINPKKYIQHNLAATDGLAGLTGLLEALPKGSVKVRTVRVFEDGDYVVAHTEYNFFGPKIGFDIFRFENGLIVEHWDNLQETPEKPNPSGRTLIDGPTIASDLDKTQANKALVKRFVEDVLVNGFLDRLPSYIDGENYLQHNPQIADGASNLKAAMEAMAKAGVDVKYDRIHKVLGEGNFVLVVSQSNSTAFYDLFRVQNGKVAEHWDVVEPVPPRSEWKNGNGKF